MRALCRPRFVLSRFLRREEGSSTIEAILWIPLIFTLLIMILDVSFVYFERSQALRLIQDINRAYSVGRFDDEAEATAALRAAIQRISPNAVPAENFTTYDSTTGLITSVVNMPASDLMPVGTVPGLGSNFTIGLSAQHYMES